MKIYKLQTYLKPLLRSARFLLLAFLLLIPIAGCESDLLIVPVEVSVGEAMILIYQDTIEVVDTSSVIIFEPAFIGRESVKEVKIAYMDTFSMKLEIELNDTRFFSISEGSMFFSKKPNEKERTLKLTFRPDTPDTATANLSLSVHSNLNPDTIYNLVDSVTLQLVGVGRTYYLDIETVFIPGNEFLMGVGREDEPADTLFLSPDEVFSPRVTLSNFFIGRYEVTNQQYYEFWLEEGDSGHRPDTSAISKWPQDALDKPNHPVVGVSWEDAMAFCRWLSLRTSERYTLPTEAQWEYACRAGSSTNFYTGDSESDLDLAGWYLGNSENVTHSAGLKEPNAWGLYDMHGNVWEWCLDWYDAEYYRIYPDMASANTSGSMAVSMTDLSYSKPVPAGEKRELLVLTFTILENASGTIPVELQNISLFDELNADIAVSAVNGSIYITDVYSEQSVSGGNQIFIENAVGSPGMDVTMRVFLNSDRNTAKALFNVVFDRAKLQLKQVSYGVDATTMSGIGRDMSDPQGPAGDSGPDYKVIRGGSWHDEMKDLRSTNRGALYFANKENNVGFRVVRLP